MITNNDLKALDIDTHQITAHTRAVIKPPHDKLVFVTDLELHVDYHHNTFTIYNTLTDEERKNKDRALEILRDRINTDIIVKLQDYTTHVLSTYETIVCHLTKKPVTQTTVNNNELIWHHEHTPNAQQVFTSFIQILNNLQLNSISLIGVEMFTQDIVISEPDILHPSYLGTVLQTLVWLPERMIFKRDGNIYISYDPHTYELRQLPTKKVNDFKNELAKTNDRTTTIHKYTLPVVQFIEDAMRLAKPKSEQLLCNSAHTKINKIKVIPLARKYFNIYEV